MHSGRRHARSHNHAPGVAPIEMIRDDFRTLDSRETLRTTYDIEQLILMQTVEGHAHEGHGLFYGNRYPNTTMDDISRALRLSPSDVQTDRQCLIDDIRTFAERVAKGENLRSLVTEEDEPILGIGTFRTIDIDARGVLQGLYLGGLRDRADFRREAQEKYGVQIGFGKSYYVDRSVMHRMGLNGEMLARQGHETEIEEFRRRGLIVDSRDGDTSYMYIRHHVGPGASDDAAIVIAGVLYGLSAAIGCFLADAIDTLEKYVPDPNDQDAFVSELIEKSGYDIGISRDAVVDLTYLAAVPEGNHGVPDSSLRHLLSVDRKRDQCALESHLLYVQGKPFARQELDHGQCTNVEFYHYIEERLASIG